MRKSSWVWAIPCAALVGVLTPAMIAGDIPSQGVPGSTGVSLSPHNLSRGGVQVGSGQVCLPCHTSHGAQAGQPALWNHRVNTGMTYSLYNTTHSTRFRSNYVGLDTASKLCLSCHDGAIAVDSFSGMTAGTHFVTGTKAVGQNGDLGSVHPVGLRYPGSSFDGKTWRPTPGYNDPTSPRFSAEGVGGNKGVQLIDLADGSKGVGCLSCHSSHNNTNGRFLRTDMKYSFLCLKCHDT